MSIHGVKFRGTVDVPNLSEENGADDLDVSPPDDHIVNGCFDWWESNS